MKRWWIWGVVAALAVLAVAGAAVYWHGVLLRETIAVVRSNGTEVEARVRVVSSLEDGLFSDSATIGQAIQQGGEDGKDLPAVVYAQDFAVDFAKRAQLRYIYVYDDAGEPVREFGDVEEIGALAAGEYIVSFRVNVDRGWSRWSRNYDVCECVVRLVKDVERPLKVCVGEVENWPYLIEASEEKWQEGITAEGTALAEILPDMARELPRVWYEVDADAVTAPGVELQGLLLYTMEGVKLPGVFQPAVLKELVEGERLGVFVVREGETTWFAAVWLVRERDSLLVVRSNGEDVSAYEHWVSGLEKLDNDAIFADGPTLKEAIDEIGPKLPVVTYAEDFAVMVADDAELRSILVRSENGELLKNVSDVAELETLPTGEYIVGFKINRQDEYIEEMETYAYSVYECAVRLVQEREFLLLVRSNGEEVVAYEHPVSSLDAGDGGMIASGGPSIAELLETEAEKLPWVTYAPGFSVELMDDEAELRGISVYSMDGMWLRGFSGVEQIARLPAWEYVLVFDVVVQGEYVEEMGAYEKSGFECAVRMRKEA